MTISILERIPGFTALTRATEKLRYLVLLALVAALPFEMYFSSMLSGLLVILTLADLNRAAFNRVPRQFWIFQGVYLLAIAGYLPSLHHDHAGFILERQLSILLMPVVLPIALPVTRELVRGCVWSLCFSCAVAICILFANALHTVLIGIRQPLSALLEGPFFNHQFSRPLGIHAGYLSLYVAFSGLFVVKEMVVATSWLKRSLLALCLLVFCAGMVFLAARTVLIATCLIMISVFPFLLLRRPIPFVLVLLIVCSVLALSISSVPYLRHRFTTELFYDISPVQAGHTVQYYNTEPRIERWQAALELIKRSPWTGYGTGDEIPMLKTGYAQRGLYISYLEDFNAHNQYLSYLIKNGVIGLAAFIGFFAFYAWVAFRSRDFLYITFLVLLLSSFYTENILDANKGILFFAIFNTLLGYASLKGRVG